MNKNHNLARQVFIGCMLFFVSLVGCAARNAESVFGTIPTGKSTSSTYRFRLIDDFNGGVSKTKVGTEWKTSEVNGIKLTLMPEREDAVKYGGSLRIDYELPANEVATVFAPLDGLDASQAQFVILLIRKKDFDNFPGKISIALGDGTGKSVATEIHREDIVTWKGPKGDWLEVIIPRNIYQELDFDNLARFEIGLLSPTELAKGQLTIDEVGFFGADELVFKSDQDNLIGFPSKRVHTARRDQLLGIRNDRKFMLGVARDTWLYFENLVDRDTGFVVDHVRVGEASGIGSYISPTNLALYWLANITAFDLSLISKERAIRNIELSLKSFETLNHWGSGFSYNYYHTHNLKVTRKYVSVVDNGWLAAGLIVMRQAFPKEFGQKATQLLQQLDFSDFYDSTNSQLKLGFDAEKDVFSPYHYGLLVTEARIASYIAIGKGDLKKEHWARIYRTLPVDWDWQKQVPEGTETVLFGVPVFEGHYTYLGKKFVPSWGGSLFEFLSPTLLINEKGLAPKGLGKNNEVATDLHIEHARQHKYPIWGMAPCAIKNGRYWIYREYGITALGTKGYPERGVVAPYASFLALATRPEAAVQNLRTMLKHYPDVYGEYGFYDSIDVLRGTVNPQYLILDQAMSFLAIANYLKDGVLVKRFHADPVGKAGEALLREENFSIN